MHEWGGMGNQGNEKSLHREDKNYHVESNGGWNLESVSGAFDNQGCNKSSHPSYVKAGKGIVKAQKALSITYW